MKQLFISVLLLCAGVAVFAQGYSWEAVRMDGSRTGCTATSKDNIEEALGCFEGCRYIAPNGRTYARKSSVAKVARIVLDAQPAMARVKDVIAYSPAAMNVSYPESALSNWYVDVIMRKVEELAGRKVDVGVCNFGGIRVDMPEGDVILDDLLSMFPFRNQLVYVEHKGREIRKMLESMAESRFQVLGGVRVVVEDGQIVSAEIGGEPIDDDKVYGVATISFLLAGGDGLALASNAVDLQSFDVDIIDAMLEHVKAETEAGRPVEYHVDGRVIIR